MKKKIAVCIVAVVVGLILFSCDLTSTQQNVIDTKIATEQILANQATPTDIDWSLERFNLIKRAYWVNGQREKADLVPCPVDRPIGFIILFSNDGTIIGNFTVDGKITSLNSYLSADSEYYEYGTAKNNWLADVDGSYGVNVDGIFFFTVDGHYMEWTGNYLYSDVPFDVKGLVNE